MSGLNTSSCRGCFFSHFQVSSFTRALFTSLLVGRPPPSPLESSTFTWWGWWGRISLWVAAIPAISRGGRDPHTMLSSSLLQPLVPPTYKGPGMNIGICTQIFQRQSIAQHFLRHIMEKSPRYLFLRDEPILTSRLLLLVRGGNYNFSFYEKQSVWFYLSLMLGLNEVCKIRMRGELWRTFVAAEIE